MTTHAFDTVPLPLPSRGHKDTCGVCGGLMSEHPEAPENMRELLRDLAEALCDTSVVARALRDRLAKYLRP